MSIVVNTFFLSSHPIHAIRTPVNHRAMYMKLPLHAAWGTGRCEVSREGGGSLGVSINSRGVQACLATANEIMEILLHDTNKYYQQRTTASYLIRGILQGVVSVVRNSRLRAVRPRTRGRPGKRHFPPRDKRVPRGIGVSAAARFCVLRVGCC